MAVVAAFAVPHPPIILSEVGRGEEVKIKRTIAAYKQISSIVSELKPETIVVISPHSVMYEDYFHISPGKYASGDMARFGAPELKAGFIYDDEFVSKLSALAADTNIPAGTQGERDSVLDHGALIPLLFINRVYKDYTIVRIGLSGLSPLVHYNFGKLVDAAALELNRRTVIIASGDLSHKLLKSGPYGFAPEGARFDNYITSAFTSGDFLKLLDTPQELSDAAGECGLRSFQIMAGTLNNMPVKSELLSYEGPFGVGYAIASFIPQANGIRRDIGLEYELLEKSRMIEHRACEDDYVRFARLVLETYVRTGDIIEPPDSLPREFISERAGTFVSLKNHGRLRGCIGTIMPTTANLALEIRDNVLSAGTNDPRFTPIDSDELGSLIYSVDVMGAPERITDKSALDIKKYGLIVQRGQRRGLLLPNLDGVNSVDEQISIAKQKAGITEDDILLYRFTTTRHI